MKKFVFLYFGFEPLTEEIKQAWGKWFVSIGDKMVDSGNPFGPEQKSPIPAPKNYRWERSQ